MKILRCLNISAQLLLVVFFSSCASTTPTATPAPITLCDPVAPVSTEVHRPQFKNKFVMFLVDKSTSYRRFDVKHDYAIESLDMITRMLPRVISPGDEIYISWFGNYTSEKKIFRGKVKNLLDQNTFDVSQLPKCPATPLPMSTLESEGGSIHRKHVQETNEAIVATATAQTNMYNCMSGECNKKIAKTLTAVNEGFITDVEGSKSDFLNLAIPPILEAKNQGLDDTTEVYEGIYTMSRLMVDPSVKGKYQNYILIIFSDMEHEGDKFKGEIDLTGVNVIVANMYCAAPTTCRDLEYEWSSHFRDWNATTQLFSYVFQTNDDSLVEVIHAIEGDK